MDSKIRNLLRRWFSTGDMDSYRNLLLELRRNDPKAYLELIQETRQDLCGNKIDYTCNICKMVYCVNCREKCAYCDAVLCQCCAIKIANKLLCSSCSKKCCDCRSPVESVSDIGICKDCDELLCIQCDVACEDCLSTLCNACAESCPECETIICGYCASFCDVCSLNFLCSGCFVPHRNKECSDPHPF